MRVETPGFARANSGRTGPVYILASSGTPLAFAACLLYSFTASGDYLLAMDLTEEQRGIYNSASMVTQAFSVFSVVVFGLALVGFLAVTLGSTSFASIVAGTIGVTVALLGVYFVFTSRANERMLLGSCLE